MVNNVPNEIAEELRAIEECLQGNTQAYELLVRQNEKKVYNLCYYLTGNHDDAQDLAQEVFIKAFYNLSGFRGESSLYTWLHKIAANTWVSWQRKQKKAMSVSLDRQNEEGGYAMELPDPRDGPEEKAQAREFREFFTRALDSVRDEFRLTLVLREIDGLSYEEIASITKCSMGTVKSRLNRARQLLKEKMKQFLRADT